MKTVFFFLDGGDLKTIQTSLIRIITSITIIMSITQTYYFSLLGWSVFKLKEIA